MTYLQRHILSALDDPCMTLDLDLFALIVAELHGRVKSGAPIDPLYAALVNCLGRQIEDDRDNEPGEYHRQDNDRSDVVFSRPFPFHLFPDGTTVPLRPSEWLFNGFVVGSE